MHKTLYIDIDEEITAIIDRIKKETADEIYLVIPKGAMITQGVINLKILKKETSRLGKDLLIASSDPHARKVVEQLGIKTSTEKELKDQMRMSQGSFEDDLSERAVNESVTELKNDQDRAVNRSSGVTENVGSEGFFDESVAEEPFENEDGDSSFSKAKGVVEKRPEELRAELFSRKNKAEEVSAGIDALKIPAKKSVAFFNPAKEQEREEGRALNKQISAEGVSGARPKIPLRIPNKNLLKRAPVSQVYESNGRIQMNQNFSYKKNEELNKKAEKFFLSEDSSADVKKRASSDDFDAGSRKESNSNGKNDNDYFGGGDGFKFFTLKKLVALLFIGGFFLGGYFWFNKKYPRVEAVIHLKNEQFSKELKIFAQGSDVKASDEDLVILGAVKEFEVEKKLKIKASGESFATDDGKAKGKVIIYNYFSTVAQPLVKTTRILSENGKLFRLSESVTVPGMKGDQPGEIEASVIADQPGEDFNVGPAKFTIEGFKNNPGKYDKFKVESKFEMTGGGQPDQNKKVAVVSADDINIARTKTVEALENELELKISEKLADGEKVLIDSIEKEIVASQSSSQIGQAVDEFEFSVKEKIRAIVFNQQDLFDLIQREVEKESGSDYVIKDFGKIVFKKGIADFERGILTVYVQTNIKLEPKINLDEVKAGILGKKQEGIQDFLANYPKIEKIEITFNPSWINRVPSDPQKVKLEKIE